MNSDSEPSRFKESNFRRFEPILRAILDRWPQRSVFKPTNISVETFAARLRDSVTAFTQSDCMWESDINKDQLREVWAKKHVKIVGNTIVVCLATSNRKQTSVVYEEGASGQQELKELIVDHCTDQHLIAIATLLNDGKLDIPFRITNSPFGSAEYATLTTQFPNVNYVPVPDGFMLL